MHFYRIPGWGVCASTQTYDYWKPMVTSVLTSFFFSFCSSYIEVWNVFICQCHHSAFPQFKCSSHSYWTSGLTSHSRVLLLGFYDAKYCPYIQAHQSIKSIHIDYLHLITFRKPAVSALLEPATCISLSFREAIKIHSLNKMPSRHDPFTAAIHQYVVLQLLKLRL